MAYNVKKVENISETLKKENREKYKYALVYRLSEIKLCKTEQLTDADFDECTEARLFSADRELHLFETEEGMCAVEVADDGASECILKKYELASRFSKEGKTLVVKEYLDYDEDGQAVVCLTRLADLE